MECLPVHIAVHLRICKEYLGRAALGDDLQHARLLEFLDGLRGQYHRSVQFAPGFLCLNHIVADGLVADEQPRFIEQEDLEGGEFLRVGDFVRGPVKYVEQQWLQNIGRITPAGEVESLEAAECQRVGRDCRRESHTGQRGSNGAAVLSVHR